MSINYIHNNDDGQGEDDTHNCIALIIVFRATSRLSQGRKRDVKLLALISWWIWDAASKHIFNEEEDSKTGLLIVFCFFYRPFSLLKPIGK